MPKVSLTDALRTRRFDSCTIRPSGAPTSMR
jgi:hypothetical protein